MHALIIGVTYNPSQNSLVHLLFLVFFFVFFSTFYFNFMKLCYIALLMTPIMIGINNLCPVIIVK